MSEEPWYHEGLKFSCTGCGDCCTGATGAVWVDEENLEQIAELLGKPVGEIRLMHTRPLRGKVSLTEFPNGDCTFFDGKTRRCTIYSARPPQCKTWPFWNSNLSDEKTWRETQKECPGAGTGELVSLQEIEKRASVIEL